MGTLYLKDLYDMEPSLNAVLASYFSGIQPENRIFQHVSSHYL